MRHFPTKLFSKNKAWLYYHSSLIIYFAFSSFVSISKTIVTQRSKNLQKKHKELEEKIHYQLVKSTPKTKEIPNHIKPVSHFSSSMIFERVNQSQKQKGTFMSHPSMGSDAFSSNSRAEMTKKGQPNEGVPEFIKELFYHCKHSLSPIKRRRKIKERKEPPKDFVSNQSMLVKSYSGALFSAAKEKKRNLSETLYLSKIDSKMRRTIIEWMEKIIQELEAGESVLFRSVFLLDAYLRSAPEVKRTQVKPIGLSCLLIALKLENYSLPFGSFGSASRENPEAVKEIKREIIVNEPLPLSLLGNSCAILAKMPTSTSNRLFDRQKCLINPFLDESIPFDSESLPNQVQLVPNENFHSRHLCFEPKELETLSIQEELCPENGFRSQRISLREKETRFSYYPETKRPTVKRDQVSQHQQAGTSGEMGSAASGKKPNRLTIQTLLKLSSSDEIPEREIRLTELRILEKLEFNPIFPTTLEFLNVLLESSIKPGAQLTAFKRLTTLMLKETLFEEKFHNFPAPLLSSLVLLLAVHYCFEFVLPDSCQIGLERRIVKKQRRF